MKKVKEALEKLDEGKKSVRRACSVCRTSLNNDVDRAVPVADASQTVEEASKMLVALQQALYGTPGAGHLSFFSLSFS